MQDVEVHTQHVILNMSYSTCLGQAGVVTEQPGVVTLYRISSRLIWAQPRETPSLASSSLDIYVDDLLREVHSECPGVPLPVAEEPEPTSTTASTEAAEGSPQPAEAALTALMFADDFTGVTATAAGLQKIVDICERWCATPRKVHV
jgi:hypothetical protein